MTPAQIVAIAFRLFAIWMAIACIQSLALFPAFDSNFERGLVIVNVVLYAATAAALWFFPLSIAGTILSKNSAAPPAPLTSDGLVRAGIVCSGLLLYGLKLPAFNSALFAMFEDNLNSYVVAGMFYVGKAIAPQFRLEFNAFWALQHPAAVNPVLTRLATGVA